MFTRFKAAALAVVLSSIAASATPAAAYDGHWRFSHPHVRFGIYLGEYPPYGYRIRRRCSPEQALYKASLFGVRAAHIDYVNERRIGVVGLSRGEAVYLTFGRAPGCPRY
jgi:hypothetical protein